LYRILFASESIRSRDNGAGIATGYGLEDRVVGVRVTMRAIYFPLHSVQTGSEAHPVSYPRDMGNSFPGDIAARALICDIHLPLAQRPTILGSIHLFPPYALRGKRFIG
jgi:hypothetical protein